MLENVELVKADELVGVTASMLARGARFVTATCVDCGDHFDILYHFDLDYRMTTLRLQLGRDEELPSISSVCFASIITENEIQDLYGIKVKDLALDYQGRFYLSEGAPDKPLCRVPGVMVTEVVKTPAPKPEGEAK